MKRKIGIIIITLIVVSLAFGLMACSSSSASSNTTTTKTESTTTKAPTKAPTKTTTTPTTTGGSSGGVFTNKYGTPTTKCAHTGCDNYIASSGDTNCCTTHSRRCLNCNKYIDEDALYCIDCLAAALSND